MRGRRWSRALVVAAVMAAAVVLASGLATELKTSWGQAELLSRAVREPDVQGRARAERGDPIPERRPVRSAPRLRRSARLRRPAGRARLHRRAPGEVVGAASGCDRSWRVSDLSREDCGRHHGARPRRGHGVRGALSRAYLCRFRRHSAADRGQPAVHREPGAPRAERVAPQSRSGMGPHGRGALGVPSGTWANPGLKPPGGSTLATQIEKYRHAPAGRTEDVAAKLRQMVSASLRAYRDGPDTSAARRQIVVDYLNSTPLSARAGFGEVNGLGDGLWAWFGTDFELCQSGAARAGARRRVRSRAGAHLQAGAQPAARPAPAVLLSARRPRRARRSDRQLPPPARRARR